MAMVTTCQMKRAREQGRVDDAIREMREEWAPDLISVVSEYILAEWVFTRPNEIPGNMDIIDILCKPDVLLEATAGHPYYEYGLAGRYDDMVRVFAIAILEDEMSTG